MTRGRGGSASGAGKERSPKRKRGPRKSLSEQYEREKALLKRAKRRASANSSRSLTVHELLDRYLQALDNPATRKTTAYHITSILDIFGKRRALRMTLDDVDGWIAVQQSEASAHPQLTAGLLSCGPHTIGASAPDMSQVILLRGFGSRKWSRNASRRRRRMRPV